MGASSRWWALKRESYENRSAVSVHVGQSDHRGRGKSFAYLLSILMSCLTNDNDDDDYDDDKPGELKTYNM